AGADGGTGSDGAIGGAAKVVVYRNINHFILSCLLFASGGEDSFFYAPLTRKSTAFPIFAVVSDFLDT
ncbi:MAG: hypothetical protein AAF798_16515, partial [Bacteroidota bacterium]